MIDGDPLFVSGPGGDYYLSQTSAGQAADSPCLNAGSGPASGVCFVGAEGTYCMNDRSSRTDGIDDTGTVDIGCHYPGVQIVDSSFTCLPVAGTVPFSTQMTVSLVNAFTGQTRRIAGRINIELASGQAFGN
jgi:hypothetical protein